MQKIKYSCPNCNQKISDIQYIDGAICQNVYTKCKKCGKIVEISIKPNKTIDKQNF